MKYTVASETQHTLEFSNWNEFVRYANETPSDMPQEKRASLKFRPVRFRYNAPRLSNQGTANFPEAIAYATQGWADGVAYTKETIAHLNIPAVRAKTTTRFSPHGPGSLSMGRYINGHPKPVAILKDTLNVSKGRARSGGIVRLGINISQSYKVSAADRWQYGCVILTLIEMLERYGKQVELTLFNAVSAMSTRVGALSRSELNALPYIRQSVKLKSAGERSNNSILSFALGNAATQRRLCWAVRETLPSEIREVHAIGFGGGGYGVPDPLWHDEDMTLLPGLGIGIEEFQLPSTRIAWLQTQLRNQGIEWDGK